MSLLVYNGYVITLDQNQSILYKGAVFIENNEIKEIGPSNEMMEKYKDPVDLINANGKVIMPGMICAHMHFYSAFATGMSLPPFDKGFHNVLKHLWWKIDKALLKDDIYYSALLGYIQAVRSGTTSVIDHHASPSYIKGSLDLIEDAGRELGVRSNLCYEVTDRNGKEGAEDGLQENERYLKRTLSQKDSLFGGLIGLHANFTIDNDTLDFARNIQSDLETGIHVHVAEGHVDEEITMKNYQMRPIQRLDKYHLLNEKSLLAHCIHLEEEDYPLLKQREVNISHQPRSNMNNSVGVIDVNKLAEHSIPFGMGTDGMSSDMKPEVFTGMILQKHHQQNNTIGMGEMYDALFDQNRLIFKKITGQNIGALVPGYKADIIISDYRPKTPISSDNVMGHLMFGVVNESIDTTIIDGSIRMLHHEIPYIDEVQIHDKSMQLAQKVWDRID